MPFTIREPALDIPSEDETDTDVEWEEPQAESIAWDEGTIAIRTLDPCCLVFRLPEGQHYEDWNPSTE